MLGAGGKPRRIRDHVKGGVSSLQSERQGRHEDRSWSPVSEACDYVKSLRLITALKPALCDGTGWAEDWEPWAGWSCPWV